MSIAVTTAELARRSGIHVEPADATMRPLPWYARAVAGAAAWWAALAFLSCLTLLELFGPEQFAVLAIPGAIAAVALRRLRLPGSDFVHQLALIAALTARACMGFGLYANFHTLNAVALGMVAFEVVLLLAFPDGTQRYLSTVSAGWWSLVLLTDEPTHWMVDAVSVGFAGAALLLWSLRAPLERAATHFDLQLGWHPDEQIDTRIATGLAAPVAMGLTTLALALPLRTVFLPRPPLTSFVGGLFGMLALALVAWLLATHEMSHRQKIAATLGAIALCGLSIQVPGLALAVAFSLVGLRVRSKVLMGLSMAFVVGYGISYYHQLHLPLMTKGAALVASGALLLALRWVALSARDAGPSDRRFGAIPRAWAALGVVLALGGTATRTVAAERTLLEGDRVYLRLAPVDPRSLVQGDFMRLNYDVANDINHDLRERSTGAEERAVVHLDDKGVGHYVRAHAGEDLGEGDYLVRFHKRGRRARLVANAFLFQEGHAELYEGAKYGEFALLPSGRGTLVALTDDDFRRLGPQRSRW
jgi:uncharacterized membrane-anchored protein